MKKDFRTILKGVMTILASAQDAYGAWSVNAHEDCLAELEQIIKDCDTLKAQATRLLDGLKAPTK